MIDNCKSCYYRDICHGQELCATYIPITIKISEKISQKNIELNREEFYHEWFDYMEEHVFL